MYISPEQYWSIAGNFLSLNLFIVTYSLTQEVITEFL